MSRRTQSNNLMMCGSDSIQVANTTGGLVAGRSGSTNDGVLLFVGGTVAITEWGVAITNDAAAGTSLRIFRPGLYLVELGGTVAAGTTVNVGVSLNQTAGFTGDPSFANAGTLDVLAATAPAGNVAAFKITTPVAITPALAGNATSGGSTLRFLGSNGAGGAPAGLTQAAAYYRITRIASIY